MVGLIGFVLVMMVGLVVLVDWVGKMCRGWKIYLIGLVLNVLSGITSKNIDSMP